MKKFSSVNVFGLLVLAAALLAAPCLEAQTVMPLPPHNSTYTGYIRGFWFQSPADICITHIEAPTETSGAVQSVQMFIMPAPPPNYPSNASQTLAFWAGNQPYPGPVDTGGIDVLAGDYVGFLGGKNPAGCTGYTANSYGTGAFNSTIDGNTVSIQRYGHQGANACTSPVPNYWGVPMGSSGSIGRLYVTYTAGLCGGQPPPGGGCSPSQCAFLDCSICDVQDTADSIEGKVDALTINVNDVKAEIVDLTADVADVKAEIVDVKAEMVDLAVAVDELPCEIIVLLSQLPHGEAIPTTHPCYEPPVTIGGSINTPR